MEYTIEVTRKPRLNPDWRDDAACQDHDNPDIFFTAEFYKEAKEVCAQCPVIVECLAEGIRQDTLGETGGLFGIWGGLEPKERERFTGRKAA